MAARCSLAVRDSLRTSMCCLLSENWLVSVSSLVCKPSSSVSFLERSCFTCSIWKRQRRRAKREGLTWNLASLCRLEWNIKHFSQTLSHVISDLVLHKLGVATVHLHLLHLLLTLLTAQEPIGFHHKQLLLHVSQATLHWVDFCILGLIERKSCMYLGRYTTKHTQYASLFKSSPSCLWQSAEP